MHRRVAASSGVLLAACALLVACGGSDRAARLDSHAVAVADAFTRVAWNKHDCQAGSRFLVSGACPDEIPAGTFPLTSHRIQPKDCGHGPRAGGYRISTGCIEYTAKSGETLQYDMTKTPHGWRIIETGTSSP